MTISTLTQMLAYRRPHQSKTERRFIQRFIEPLGVTRDRMGNLIKRVGDSPVLWSSHTDSVHRHGGQQRVCIAGDTIKLPAKTDSNCLGADCATGVWLMCEMIQYKVPGLYVFHRGEERGGIGSSYIAKHEPETLDGIKAAIALDRYGTQSIITHQWSRCCSDLFAESLGASLGMGHKADSTGVFTDTANYVDLVGECSNLSVGYVGHHGREETQSISYVQELREALLMFDSSRLDYSRKPGDEDESWSRYSYTTGGKEEPATIYASHDARLMRELIERNPEELVDLLSDLGYDSHDLAQYVFDRGGDVPQEMFSQ
jgi:hypothetical protein